MKNDDTLKHLRKILKASDHLSDERIEAVLGSKTGEDLSDKDLSKILDALIAFKRGESKSPAPIEPKMDNNIILKKIRIAFELKEEDLLKFAEEASAKTTPREWSGYFRKADHKHYRPCPDEYLEMICKALQKQKSS